MKRLSVQLDKDLILELKNYCYKREVLIKDVIAQLIRDLLDKESIKGK